MKTGLRPGAGGGVCYIPGIVVLSHCSGTEDSQGAKPTRADYGEPNG